jgi:hypothetical protein
MITTNPIVDAGTGSEIQICPWYLVKLRGWKVADWNSLNKVAWGGLAKVLMDPIARRVYAPIDYYNLFDKVVLHEVCAFVQILNKANFMGS